MKKFYFLVVTTLVLCLSLLALPTSSKATANIGNEECLAQDEIALKNVEIVDEDYIINTDIHNPETILPAKVIGTEIDKSGNLVTKTEDLDEFIIEADGDIIAEGQVIATGDPTNMVDASSVCGTYTKIKTLSNVKVSSNIFMNYHPSFRNWDKVNGYFFGQTSVSYSISVSAYNTSLGVSVAPPGNGTFIKADANKWSRPAIYGDIYKKTYTVSTYTCTGKLKSTSAKKISYSAKNTYIKAKYK
ncbi:hypothetical protein [Metabacillus halosaccharovorans]|uniref:hypothetical protein n=1 Tax=Metabacillus halosaccharovorans TaxID=930124 RepID=UPI00373536FE